MELAVTDALDEDFDNYVSEILAAARPGMTRAEFNSMTKLDVNAGYHAQVAEAERRYFAAQPGG